MRYSAALTGPLALGLALLAPGCATAEPEPVAAAGASHAEALTEGATVRFAAQGAPSVSGPLAAGTTLTVAYDPARLTGCRGDTGGHAAWAITGYYRLNGGSVSSFEAGGFSPSQGTSRPVIPLSAAGELEVWFQNTSVWGCSAWDSASGRNYHFRIAASNGAPGFVGNAVSVVSRATCAAGPCDGDRNPLENGAHYDTWARQRAAIKSVYFDVWKEGVTDFDNAALWQALDVQVHYRALGQAAFQTRYVAFDRRVGHDARYAVPLATLDPLPGGPNGSGLTNPADCPSFATTLSGAPGSQYIAADVELYMTVNGAELRPAGGGTFRVTFENYEGLYAVCRR